VRFLSHSPSLFHNVSHICIMLLNYITLLHIMILFFSFLFWEKDYAKNKPYLTNTRQTAWCPFVRNLGTTVLRLV